MLKFALNKTDAHETYPQAPSKAHATDAGYDLRTTNTFRIYPGESKLVLTGVHASIPVGFYGRVADRSSMAVKGLRVGAGVIDSAYRGEIKVLLTNVGQNVIDLLPGDKIAQLIITRLYEFEADMVPFEDLNATDRGSGGFGSTGR